MVDAELLKILICPKCRAGLKPLGEGDAEKLVCQNPECGLRYPVRDNIPVMLIEEAEQPKQ